MAGPADLGPWEGHLVPVFVLVPISVGVCAHFPRSAYSLESPLIPESLLLHESTPMSGTDPAKHKSFNKLQHHAFEGGQLGPDVGNWSACRLGLALRDSRVGVSRDLVSRLKVE